MRFLLIDTKVPKNTKRQVQLFRERKDAVIFFGYHLYQQLPAIMNPLIQSIGAISLECKSLFAHTPSIDTIHDRLETLIDMNHALLCAGGMGHKSLERIRAITSRHNLFSKLTGAGGGGCALALLRPETDLATIKQVKEALSREGFVAFEANVGCPGVVLEFL